MPVIPSHQAAHLAAGEKPTWVRVLEGVLLYAIYAASVCTAAAWVLQIPPR